MPAHAASPLRPGPTPSVRRGCTPRRAAERALESPSALAPDLQPGVERALLQCLESDPQQRTKSARAVAALLPGGDPLAAALAAGETPSPEMVAAAGGEGALHWRVGLVCLRMLRRFSPLDGMEVGVEVLAEFLPGTEGQSGRRKVHVRRPRLLGDEAVVGRIR